MYKPNLALLVSCIFWLSIARQTNQQTITLDLKSFHDGQMFYTPMTVGRGEYEKTFRMLVATSYQMTWIVSTNVSLEHGYDDRSSVGHNSRRYFLYLTPTWYGYFSYYIHNDIWKVSSDLPPINNQPFAALYPVPGHDDGMIEGVDGMLGLNDGTSEPDDVDYLFKNLYKSNYIDHLMYSLYINKTAVANRRDNNNDDSQSEGALVLGGIDEKYYIGDLKYVKMHDDGQWKSYSNKSLFISNIRLDWNRSASGDKLNDSISRLGTFDIDMEEPARLKLDSSLILYYGERQALDRIHLGILKADPILRNFFYAFKDCRLDNKPDIVFTLKDGFDVTITPEEYVIEKEIHNFKVCLSAFKPCRENVWVFGTEFMRKYYTVFDYENARVGFATPA